MSDQLTLLQRAASLDVSPELAGYTKVRIYCGQNSEGEQIIYEAGDETGQTLDIRNPFGSQEMADNILTSVRGFQYQPYKAGSALLNPAAEMGDGVTIHGIYSGIYSRQTNFGALMLSDISAPQEEEIEHEFTLESTTNREYTRFTSQVRAMLKVQADAIVAEVTARTEADDEINSQLSIQASEISAKVSKVGGDFSSFGWTLTDSSWSVYADSNEILRATADGLEVKGIIKAVEGWLGGENGFRIDANKIYKNIPVWGGTQSSGVYIGTDGIQLGQGFKVDSGGNLTATSGQFGSLNINSSGRTGGSYHGGLSGCGGSLSSGINIGSTPINTYVKNLVADTVTANYLATQIGNISSLGVRTLNVNTRLNVNGSFYIGGTRITHRTIKDGDGVSRNVLIYGG